MSQTPPSPTATNALTGLPSCSGSGIQHRSENNSSGSYENRFAPGTPARLLETLQLEPLHPPASLRSLACSRETERAAQLSPTRGAPLAAGGATSLSGMPNRHVHHGGPVPAALRSLPAGQLPCRE